MQCNAACNVLCNAIHRHNTLAASKVMIKPLNIVKSNLSMNIFQIDLLLALHFSPVC